MALVLVHFSLHENKKKRKKRKYIYSGITYSIFTLLINHYRLYRYTATHEI